MIIYVSISMCTCVCTYIYVCIYMCTNNLIFLEISISLSRFAPTPIFPSTSSSVSLTRKHPFCVAPPLSTAEDNISAIFFFPHLGFERGVLQIMCHPCKYWANICLLFIVVTFHIRPTKTPHRVAFPTPEQMVQHYTPSQLFMGWGIRGRFREDVRNCGHPP